MSQDAQGSRGTEREATDPVPVIVFLSGSRRGATVRLGGERLCIGTDPGCEVRIPLDTAPLPLPHHATLERRGDSYELIAAPDAAVWVNGERVDRLVLASGDVIEVGRDGALLRYRLYPAGSEVFKSLPEIFADSYQGARATRGVVGKARVLGFGLPHQVATATSRRFRWLVAVAVLLLATVAVVEMRRSADLERRLLREVQRVEGLSRLITDAERAGLGGANLDDVLTQLEETSVRVGALEARNDAAARVVAEATRSTLFLQGGYRFMHPELGEPLRLVLGPDGRPVRNFLGHPALSMDGDGPPLEIFVTGTGFVATAEGFVVTNRHVAMPWDFDDAAAGILSSGFLPRWNRFLAFYPGVAEPVEVRLVLAAEDADLALLECAEDCARLGADLPFTRLAPDPPTAGEAVVVLGYPLGLRALLARSDAGFVAELRDEGVDDFYEQAVRLAQAGFMAPLASRGIVGQVTVASVVYDAETTSGGSGGPVLTLDGAVVAVNSAILPEFGGSNLGVPAARVRALIERAQGN